MEKVLDRHLEVIGQLRLARAYASNRVPYFAVPLYSAKLIVTADLPALAAIDSFMRVYFNPDLVLECLASSPHERAIEQLGWVWIHELSHAIRNHGERAKRVLTSDTFVAAEANTQSFVAQHHLWNIACDCEINDNDFRGLAHPTVYKPITPRTFGWETGHLAEYYFERIAEMNDPSTVHRYIPNEGSGVHNVSCPWELTPNDKQFPGLSVIHQASLRESVAGEIRSAADRGNLPSGWLRWAQSVAPKVDWRNALRSRLQWLMTMIAARKTDYSYRRPNRRASAYYPFVRPGLCGPPELHLAVVVDTSGSMDQTALNSCMSEIRGILEATQAAITAIPCDSMAYEPISILSQSDVIKASGALRGGGGTDMVVGIEAALQLERKPDAIIVLTDGYTPYPENPYGRTPVVFGILHANRSTECSILGPNMPPWREQDVIRIPIS